MRRAARYAQPLPFSRAWQVRKEGALRQQAMAEAVADAVAAARADERRLAAEAAEAAAAEGEASSHLPVSHSIAQRYRAEMAPDAQTEMRHDLTVWLVVLCAGPGGGAVRGGGA